MFPALLSLLDEELPQATDFDFLFDLTPFCRLARFATKKQRQKSY